MKFREIGKTQEEKNIYCSVGQCLEEIIKMCGKEEIQEKALELEEKEYQHYQKRCNEIIDLLFSMSKIRREQLDFDIFVEQVPDKEFWKGIEKCVKRRTEFFLDIVPYNDLQEEQRIELLSRGFNILFIERENFEYLSRKITNLEIADAVYKILMRSEYAIVAMYVSKRRFKAGEEDACGLKEEDLEFIWKLFEDNFEAAERHAFYKRMALVSRKLNEIENKVNTLESMLSLDDEDY